MGILKAALAVREEKQKDLVDRALEEAKRISDILVKKFGATEVRLYGSLMEKSDFDECSDIDLSVKGLGDKYLKAFGYCIRMSDHNIDIRQYEDLPKRIKDIIDKKGLRLYG
jgi:predicted nucleotidyltransferase